MSSLPNATAQARLMGKTQRQANGCLLFTGYIAPNGYGRLWDGERAGQAHRVSYRIHKGPIPEGLFVCHTCDNPPCVEPSHLFTATQAGNLSDMRAKGRESRGPDHSEAIRNGWTPELRKQRGDFTRQRMEDERNAAADAAGVPRDWKYCPACSEWKPRSDYYRNAARYDGLKQYCKPCFSEKDRPRRKEYHAENREKLNAQSLEYYYANRDRILAKRRAS